MESAQKLFAKMYEAQNPQARCWLRQAQDRTWEELPRAVTRQVTAMML